MRVYGASYPASFAIPSPTNQGSLYAPGIAPLGDEKEEEEEEKAAWDERDCAIQKGI